MHQIKQTEQIIHLGSAPEFKTQPKETIIHHLLFTTYYLLVI